jgi:hypothetical protein
MWKLSSQAVKLGTRSGERFFRLVIVMEDMVKPLLNGVGISVQKIQSRWTANPTKFQAWALTATDADKKVFAQIARSIFRKRQGEGIAKAIARELGIARASVYRALAA